MTTADQQQKISYKKRLLQHCLEIIEQRIQQLHVNMEGAQASANEEAKSSAGDKYETARAMSHIQKDMYAVQLNANQAELQQVITVDCSKLYSSVSVGSMVECTGATFFIAAGLGKIRWEDKDVYLVSAAAPVASLLMGKKQGESVVFNKKDLMIHEIY
jgi:transcription elongation GreA/GreB family factor